MSSLMTADALKYLLPATVGLSYLLEPLPCVVKGLCVGSMAGLVLPLPMTLPPLSVGTMMTSVMAFTVVWKSTSLLLFPSRRIRHEVIQNSAGSTRTWPERVKGFCRWIFEYQRSFLGISPRDPEDIPSTTSAWLLELAEIAARWFGKACAGAVIRQLAVRASSAANPSTPLLYLIWTLSVAVMPTTEVVEFLTSLLSRGHWSALSFNNWFFLSHSPLNFWSRRYNSLIRTFLHDTFFVPLREAGFSVPVASAGCFALSGLLHSYVAYFTFGTGVASSFAFFALSGAVVSAEAWLQKRYPAYRNKPRWLGMVITWASLAALAPLYPGLFVRSWPLWFDVNPDPSPEMAKRFASWLLAALPQ